MADADDDSMDDEDMMDKISSSPSIDDGGLTLPPQWPSRSTSLVVATLLHSEPLHSESASVTTYREPEDEYQFSDDDAMTSSPRMSPRPAFLSQDPGRRNAGKRNVPRDISRSESLLSMNSILANNLGWEESSDRTLSAGDIESYDGDYETDASESGDPFAGQDEVSDTESDEMYFSATMETFIDDEENPLDVQYESSSEEEEEDFEFPENCDPRYIAYAYPAECLQDPEDIDFEFVYALHTFVATVEGQANATKGDTMVLLDDSNSYWWLVRVVKDSSIGKNPRNNLLFSTNSSF